MGSYKKAIALDSNNPKTWHNLGNCLVQIGEVKTSLECFSRAVALDPEFLEAKENLEKVQSYLSLVPSVGPL